MSTQSEVTGSKLGITIIGMLGALMAFVDISIVSVALNDIRASFGTPIDQIAWISTGYMMANIVVIPMTGWFQRRFGYLRYFVASVALFTLSSALCGFAWNLPSLVLFRVLQGIGGGAIVPTVQNMLFARYPKAEHGMAAGLFGLGAITGPLLGPTIGGYLIEWSSWQWIFFINVPIGIAVMILAARVIKEPGFSPPREPIDVVGIVLLAIAMPSLQYVLEEGNREGWLDSPVIIALGLVSAIALTTFVVHELETKNPVVDLRVFANRNYSAATGINLLAGVTLFGSSYLFSIYLGAVMRYSALDIGRVFLAASLVQLVVMPLIGRVSRDVDGRWLLLVGVILLAISQFSASHFTAVAGFYDLAWPQMIRAAGLGFLFIPVTVVALSDIGPAQRGNASGLFSLTRELGGSLGTAWMGMVVTDGMKTHGESLASHVHPYASGVQYRLHAASKVLHAPRWDHPLSIWSAEARTAREAMVLSFQEGFRMTAALILIGIVLVVLLKRTSSNAPVEGAH